MRFEIIYEGPLSEWPGPYWNLMGYSSAEQARELRRLLTRREALRLSAPAMLIGAAAAAFPLNGAIAQSGNLVASNISGHRVTHGVVRVQSLQEAISELRNNTERQQDGVVIADFKTNGALTDQGNELVSLAPRSFITARFTGETGRVPGRGLSTGYTSSGSRSANYQVT